MQALGVHPHHGAALKRFGANLDAAGVGLLHPNLSCLDFEAPNMARFHGKNMLKATLFYWFSSLTSPTRLRQRALRVLAVPDAEAVLVGRRALHEPV